MRQRTAPARVDDAPGKPRGRVLAGALGILMAAAGLVLAVRALSSTGEEKAASPRSSIGADSWGDVAEGWTQVPHPPQLQEGMAFAWTGSQILAWGGCDPAVEDRCVPTAVGFLFDPATWSWYPAPAAPVPGAYADAVPAGDEIIFLGLRDGERLDGEAYDPATRTWRKIADAPVTPRYGGVQVWAGSEIVVWGGGRPDDPTAHEGAAYDPATDTWRLIADAPLGLNLASGMWTGHEVLVFGSLLDSGNRADTSTSVGAAYVPATDTWRQLPPSALSPQATSAVWIGDRMVAWDYEVHSQEFDPVRNAWSAPMQMPFGFNECYPDSVVSRDLDFAFFCGQVALYDPATGTWHEIHGGPLEDEVQANSASYKLWRFAQLVPADDAVFLAMEGITVTENGAPCYGCSRSPQSFWAYRPVTP